MKPLVFSLNEAKIECSIVYNKVFSSVAGLDYKVRLGRTILE